MFAMTMRILRLTGPVSDKLLRGVMEEAWSDMVYQRMTKKQWFENV